MNNVFRESGLFWLLLFVFAGLAIIGAIVLIFMVLKRKKHKTPRNQKRKEQLKVRKDLTYDEKKRDFESFYETLRFMNKQMEKDPKSALKTFQDEGLIDSNGQVVWRSEK